MQILDVEDISRSRWEQIEELEAIERGEQTRGREIVRLPVGGEDEETEDTERGDGAATQALGPTQTQEGAASRATRQQQGQNTGKKNATHKLVLQDSKGQKMYAVELKRVDGISVGKTSIGEKILLRTWCTVSRGVILLEPASCVVLGGRLSHGTRPGWKGGW